MCITGSDLKNMRLRANKTTSEMAEYAGVKTRKTYENWEKGISTPNVNQFTRMCAGCGYTASDIIKLSEHRKNEDQRLDLSGLKAA